MSPALVSVPVSASELTDAWFRGALARRFPNANPRVLGLEAIGAGRGLSSDMIRCRLAGPDLPKSVVVKLWDTEGMAGALEVRFYQTFGERLGIRVPACHLAALDEDRRRGVLVLEDLGSDGHGDCLLRGDPPGAIALARMLARLHATWLGRSELAEAAWLPSLAVVEREEAWLAARPAMTLERFGDRLDALSRRLVERIRDVQARANERLAGAPPSLLHEDLHLDNVVFAGADIVLLDWANVSQGPIALDLAELLFAIAPLPDFDATFTAYLEELHERGAATIDAATLTSQLGGALLRRFMRTTCGIAAWKPDPGRMERILDTELARTIEAVAFWETRDPALFRF
jgi:thiamine kinase-like enzyme